MKYHSELFKHVTLVVIQNISVTQIEGQFGSERSPLCFSRIEGVAVSIIPGPHIVNIGGPLVIILAQVMDI